MINRRQLLAASAAGLGAHALSRAAFAETGYPSNLIRAIVPFSAGSTTDTVGRIVLDQLGALLGQTIIVENRGGAGGSVGASFASKAAADGYTILINGAGHSAAPAAFPNINYDPANDFAGVALLGVLPNVLVVSPSSGIKTIQDLVKKAKAEPTTFASAGLGSATHLAAERFRVAAGFSSTHVPFRGGVEGLTEVMAGRIDFTCMGVASTAPFIADGKVVALAVSTQRRSILLPDVPTTLESGYPGSDYTFWTGMFAPAKTPREIVEKLHDYTMEALTSPRVMSNFKQQGMEPLPLSSAEIDAMVKKEIVENKELVRAAGLKFG
ncbi:tripartite-type tricarboxylate transporter receptor subunit TctC [Nitrobacteraceae bacterium AZCC 2161]